MTLRMSSDWAQHTSKPDRARSQPIKFYTSDEIAEALGVSLRTVRRWIKSGALPVHRIGGLVRISEADFAAFLALRREA